MKKTLQLLCVALFMATIANAQTVGDTFTDGNYNYKVTLLSPNEVTVTGTTIISPTTITIPATATNSGNMSSYSVTSVGTHLASSNSTNTAGNDGAFEGKSTITTVTLPSTVTVIGVDAFRNCSALTSINLGNVMTIGDYAFNTCGGLTTVNLENVVTLGTSSFATCANLVTITTSGDNVLTNLQTMGNYTFNADHKILSIATPALVTAGQGSFYTMDGLKKVNIPSTLTTIGISNSSLFMGNATNSGSNAGGKISEVQVNWTSFPTNPFLSTVNFFRNRDLAAVALYVPAGTKSLYENTAPWGKIGTGSNVSGGSNTLFFPSTNIIEDPNFWVGTTDGSWSTASNWSKGVVPAATDNIVIAPNAINNLVIDSNIVIDNLMFVVAGASLTINSGVSLTINEGKNLVVVGVITNNGTITLESSATGTANLKTYSSIANVVQQRYLSSTQRGWRLLSNPLAATTFSALATDSGITLGAGYTGQYTSATDTWTSTDGTVAMASQQAYKVFITATSNATLVNKGTAVSTVPGAITTTAGKYYLVANPYAAPVSVSSILAASTNLSTSVSFYDPEKSSGGVKTVKAGGYETSIVSGVAGSATDIVIPAMGAIFVYATTAGTINVPKIAIYTGTPLQTATYNQKTAQTKTVAPEALTIEVSSNGVAYDKLQLRFKEAGTAGTNIDFGKLPNTFLDFYSIDNGNNRAISELELKEQTIPLGVTSTIEKSFTLKVAENTIPAGYDAVLVDSFLNTTTVLAPGTTYDFAIDNTAASQGNARFSITLKTSGALSVATNLLDAKIQMYPNPAHNQFTILNSQSQNDGEAVIEISNLNGQMIHSQKSIPGTTTTIQTNGWAAGVYLVKAKNNETQSTKKLIIQ